MERILVRLPNWLGDVLLAQPLLHALRHAHPAAAIAGVGPGPLLDLIAPERVLDRSHPWPREGGARRDLARRLRDWRPDAALVLPPSFSSAWLAWRTRARLRIGYRQEGRGPLLTHAPRRPARGELHLSREYLALGEALAARPVALPPLRASADAERAAREIRERPGIAGGRWALLGPGARYGPAKRWEGARFAAVGSALAGRGFRVLVCGGADERHECEAVAAAASATCVAGETDLATQAAICARASVALCNDSGLAHLAAAAGAPTVAIFGSTSSAWTAPLGARVRIVQRAPACSPCFRRTCRIGYRCLAAVGVDTVLKACLEVAE